MKVVLRGICETDGGCGMKMKARADLGYRLETPESRVRLVKFLSQTIDAGMSGEFEPYRVNEWDDKVWVLDRNNNWTVAFSGEPMDFEVRNRYQSEEVQAEEALAAWLAYRVGAEIAE